MKMQRQFLALVIPLMLSFTNLMGQTYDVNVSSIVANGDLNKMVRSNNLAGYSFGLGYKMAYGSATNTRIHFNLIGLKGLVGSGISNTDRYAFQMGFDIMQQRAGVTYYAGLTGISWRQDLSKATNPLFNNSTVQSSSSNTNYLGGDNRAGNDVKWGFRAGLEYPIAKNLLFNLNFNLTEFNKVFSPSWYSVGVTYRY